MRNQLKATAIRIASALGRYSDWPAGTRHMVRLEPLSFQGELPACAGPEMNQYPLAFKVPPERVTHVDDVHYTDDGMAWVAGRLERRFSIQEVGLRHILRGSGGPSGRYEHATLMQSDAPRTYGDWVSEHLASLAATLEKQPISEPLLLPHWWHDKADVRRDLRGLGIRSESVHGTVYVEHATVIHKTRPWLWWTKEEADVLRHTMGVVPIVAKPGSAVYLSRRGLVGEGPPRQFDNELVEAAMSAAGVRVIQTKNQTREGYQELASCAETVFGDHGSAMYNMLYWQPRRVVELFAPSYWEASFLVLSHMMGIPDYHLWRVDSDTTVDGLRQRIVALMAMPFKALPAQ